jgi:hypothetical protein
MSITVMGTLRYRIVSPPSTHTVPATCEEVNCERQRTGFQVIVDPTTDLGIGQANYIWTYASREFLTHNRPDGMTIFQFPPGTRCFAEHRRTLDRPATFMISTGRTSVRGHQVVSPTEWAERFAENQDRLKILQERG